HVTGVQTCALPISQPPDFGPLAAVTPGTPGGLMVMLAEFGTMTLEEALAPAIEMARGCPMERQASESIESAKDLLARWEESRRVLLPHYDPSRPRSWPAPRPGEVFAQPELLGTLRGLGAAERDARAAGKGREEAIMAAYDRFYRGDIGREIAEAVQRAG